MPDLFQESRSINHSYHFSFGFERLIDVITDLNLFPQANQTGPKILVANLGPDTQTNILQLITKLRNENISSIIYPDADKLGKQIRYALAENIPYMAIIGTDEAAANQITLKNLTSTSQKTINLDQLIKILKD